MKKNLCKINDNAPEVKLFFKLPRSFKIVPLIGPYTPDLAVFLEREGEQKLYFALEIRFKEIPIRRKLYDGA
ncbi:hypothetical protein [Bartonella sp. B1099]|uniref:restriction endonuclease n=1 Tax=Bartonella sp. B1099 TaxID=2911422 RepID=UPI0020C423A8|nr:hypothetical protein [Bartonella sp. B1099]